MATDKTQQKEQNTRPTIGMKAFLKNYRQAPRKVRLVADAIRGKSVDEALALLDHTPNRAAFALKRLIESAVANAETAGKEKGGLVIGTITVDKGITLHRAMPRAFGRATPIRKQTSRITIQLAERSQNTNTKSQDTKTKQETTT